MKITPLETPIPFSDRRFNVEMSGLELALVKYLVSNCSTGNLGTVSFDMYQQLKHFTKIDSDSFETELPSIELHKMSLEEFKEKIDEIDK